MIEESDFSEGGSFTDDENIDFRSDTIVSISNQEVLDADDPVNIAKCKSNIRYLISKAKECGYIDQFRLIREDDFFPNDWLWRVASKDTGREFAKSRIASELRMAKVSDNLKKKHGQMDLGFDIPFSRDEEIEELGKIDLLYGRIYEPYKFRSTKHFTINTPLSFTGNYNFVASDRNFIIIDKMDNFLNSQYGYSLDYLDAYLDVTHEGLPISMEAIVLIEDSKYDRIVSNSEIKEYLKERKVIRFRGDEGFAVNMVLSEMGVLPYKPGMGIEYDEDLSNIMNDSLKNICIDYDLDYKQGHGNIDGKGGHFSDLYDRMNNEREEFENEFIEFLRNDLGVDSQVISDDFWNNPDQAIKKIGYERIVNSINKYNQITMENMPSVLENYESERNTINPEIHELFVNTLKNIRNLYHNYSHIEIGNYSSELVDEIKKFFHSNSVSDQILAAEEVNNLIFDYDDNMLGNIRR